MGRDVRRVKKSDEWVFIGAIKLIGLLIIGFFVSKQLFNLAEWATGFFNVMAENFALAMVCVAAVFLCWVVMRLIQEGYFRE